MKKRREILENNIKVIPNRIELSELYKLKNADEVDTMMTRVLKEGLEGLVIKDANSIYEPSARHWLKIKKDYLEGMADSVDLVVLGGYYGTGHKVQSNS